VQQIRFHDRNQLDQILQARSSDDLDALAAVALQNLSRYIDPEWVRRESEKLYRLDDSFLQAPLHLVNGVRLFKQNNQEAPQRFARMLLVTSDHLDKRADLDFFSAAMFVPEIAVLGNSLGEIGSLGPEAIAKFERLGSFADDVVTSTIFELLVGAAFVRKGLGATMVAENRSDKVPDFSISGLGIPSAVECKRRLGLTAYEIDEATIVQSLYEPIRGWLKEAGIHGSIEVSFSVELKTVPPDIFRTNIREVASASTDNETRPTEWGSVAFRRLPFTDDIPRTRLYSPDFLCRVFGWEFLQSDWDGLFCEVEPPDNVLVDRYKWPMCLKWRSESEAALTKKSRGITSLWGNAIKQIPPGEIGFVYIAYPEGSRPAIANARTQHILESMADAWHRWYVRVPVAVTCRLYPRPTAEGRPDLIESVLPGVAKGQEFWLTKVPWMVFTRQF
jgi:hypothetical protein